MVDTDMADMEKLSRNNIRETQFGSKDAEAQSLKLSAFSPIYAGKELSVNPKDLPESDVQTLGREFRSASASSNQPAQAPLKGTPQHQRSVSTDARVPFQVTIQPDGKPKVTREEFLQRMAKAAMRPAPQLTQQQKIDLIERNLKDLSTQVEPVVQKIKTAEKELEEAKARLVLQGGDIASGNDVDVKKKELKDLRKESNALAMQIMTAEFEKKELIGKARDTAELEKKELIKAARKTLIDAGSRLQKLAQEIPALTNKIKIAEKELSEEAVSSMLPSDRPQVPTGRAQQTLTKLYQERAALFQELETMKRNTNDADAVLKAAGERVAESPQPEIPAAPRAEPESVVAESVPVAPELQAEEAAIPEAPPEPPSELPAAGKQAVPPAGDLLGQIQGAQLKKPKEIANKTATGFDAVLGKIRQGVQLKKVQPREKKSTEPEPATDPSEFLRAALQRRHEDLEKGMEKKKKTSPVTNQKNIQPLQPKAQVATPAATNKKAPVTDQENIPPQQPKAAAEVSKQQVTPGKKDLLADIRKGAKLKKVEPAKPSEVQAKKTDILKGTKLKKVERAKQSKVPATEPETKKDLGRIMTGVNEKTKRLVEERDQAFQEKQKKQDEQWGE